jgi:hypothetical protein
MLRRKKRSGSGGPASSEDLIGVLQSLFPRLDISDEEDPEKIASPTEVGRRLVRVALDQPDIATTSEWSDLLILVEALIVRDLAVDPPWDNFAQSFVEDLLNAVSHGDLQLTREQIDSFLLPKSTEMARYFDRVWVSKHGDEGPNVMDIERYQSIEGSELRWVIRFAFRRTDSGLYVGISDILRREAQTGRPGGLTD